VVLYIAYPAVSTTNPPGVERHGRRDRIDGGKGTLALMSFLGGGRRFSRRGRRDPGRGTLHQARPPSPDWRPSRSAPKQSGVNQGQILDFRSVPTYGEHVSFTRTVRAPKGARCCWRTPAGDHTTISVTMAMVGAADCGFGVRHS